MNQTRTHKLDLLLPKQILDCVDRLLKVLEAQDIDSTALIELRLICTYELINATLWGQYLPASGVAQLQQELVKIAETLRIHNEQMKAGNTMYMATAQYGEEKTKE